MERTSVAGEEPPDGLEFGDEGVQIQRPVGRVDNRQVVWDKRAPLWCPQPGRSAPHFIRLFNSLMERGSRCVDRRRAITKDGVLHLWKCNEWQRTVRNVVRIVTCEMLTTSIKSIETTCKLKTRVEVTRLIPSQVIQD